MALCILLRIAWAYGMMRGWNLLCFSLIITLLLDIMNITRTMIHFLFNQALVYQRLCLCRQPDSPNHTLAVAIRH
jgi:hypothetical protein